MRFNVLSTLPNGDVVVRQGPYNVNIEVLRAARIEYQEENAGISVAKDKLGQALSSLDDLLNVVEMRASGDVEEAERAARVYGVEAWFDGEIEQIQKMHAGLSLAYIMGRDFYAF